VLYNGLLSQKELSPLIITAKLSEVYFHFTFVVIKKCTNLCHLQMFYSVTPLRIYSINALFPLSGDSEYFIFMTKKLLYVFIYHNPQVKFKTTTKKVISLG
jgi:hypothetical protein